MSFVRVSGCLRVVERGDVQLEHQRDLGVRLEGARQSHHVRMVANRHDFDLVDGTFDGLTRHVALQGIRQRRRTKSERERVRRLQ